MPLDHSIVFDGGWRILNGQIPWRDFDMPSAATPSFMQALTFKVGGVTWGSYVAHAAVLNGLFCALVFSFLCRLGLRRVPAALYGAASGALLFAPVGVPFPEQHAFFFSFLALWLFLVGRTSPSAKRAFWALAFVPTALLLGFFSKQLPTGLSPLLLAALLALPATRPRKDALIGLGGGAALCFIFACLFLLWTGVEVGAINHALFELPMSAADRRMGFLPSPAKMPWHIFQVGLNQGLWSVALLHGITLGVGVLVVIKKGKDWLRVAGLLALAELVIQIDVVTIVLANNQDGVGVGWIFLALGIAHAAVARVAFETKSLRMVPAILSAGALLILARDVVHFSYAVNATRAANDMEFDADLADLTDLPAALSPMQWTVPDHHSYAAEDLVATLNYLGDAEGDFFLVGDTSILYGLTGRRSILPSAWYHPGVTLPAPGGPEFQVWQKRILANMRPIAGDEGRDEVLRIVEERAGTWVGNWSIRDMPLVWKDIKGRILNEVDLGAFRVLELSPKSPSL